MKLVQTRKFHSISKKETNSTCIYFSKASHNTGVLQSFVVNVPKTECLLIVITGRYECHSFWDPQSSTTKCAADMAVTQ